MTYGAMFEHFSKQNVLPLGILRGIPRFQTLGVKGNTKNYVFTNPDKDVELFPCDRIFVIAGTHPRAHKAGVTDGVMEIRRMEKTRFDRLSRKTVSDLSEDLNVVKTKHNVIEDSLVELSHTTNSRTTESMRRLEKLLQNLLCFDQKSPTNPEN